MSKRLLIAIDGPSGAGKSTVARMLAERLGYSYIESGAMYRAVALWAIRQNVDLSDHLALEQLAKAASIGLRSDPLQVVLNGEDVTTAIRSPEMSQAASKVSAISGVRRALVEKQRLLAQDSSVVMEGRDIGTVVFPEAQVKIFLDADPGTRAGRRARETGGDVASVARELAERDQRDRTRAEAPLLQAPDAEYLDTTGLSPAEVEEAILRFVRRRISNGKEHGS